MGAWIETYIGFLKISLDRSHPTWVRGLKHNLVFICFVFGEVAPYVGAWIETVVEELKQARAQVAPYVGAWIETRRYGGCQLSQRSHPTWVRGLKLYS